MIIGIGTGMLTRLPFQRLLPWQPEELSKGGLININEESDYDKKNEIPEEVTTKNFTLQAFLEILHTMESAKHKMSKAGGNLEEGQFTKAEKRYFLCIVVIQ